MSPLARSTRDGALTALIALGPCLLAMSRDIDWYDGPELALAAVNLGVAHPPAEPLHTLVGALLARVFPRYAGVALASVLPLVLSAIPMTALADELYPPGDTRRARALRAMPILAALWCPPAFETGTRVEVYALATLLALTALALALRGRALWAGVALGLAACANPVFAITAALGVAAALLLRTRWRSLPLTFAGGVLGLAPYAYLPWAARDPSRFAWGAPSTVPAFLGVLRAQDFSSNVGAGWSHVSTSASVLAGLLLPAFAAVAVTFVGASLGRRDRAWLAAPLVALAQTLTLLPNAALAHNPDLHGYLMPVVLLAGSALAATFSHVAASPQARLLTLAGVALPLLALTSNLPWIQARAGGLHTARAITQAVFDEAPRGAVLLSESDHLVFPALYLQEVEGVRPDLVVLNVGFGSSSWYWDHLARRHPGLRITLAPGIGRTARIRRFLDENSARPVVAESGSLLVRFGRPVYEGTFVMHADRSGARPDTARRVRFFSAQARAVDGEWIGERVVATQVTALALEARLRGSPSRAALTLSAAAPELAAYGLLLPPAPDDPRAARRAIPWPANEALRSRDWARYALGRTLVEAGDGRGVPLLREAAEAGVAMARDDLQRLR